MTCCLLLIGGILTFPGITPSPDDPRERSGDQSSLVIDGVMPHLTISAPGVGSRSETGIGALIPWADRLWAIGYVAHISGNGIGLYEIGPDLAMTRHPQSVTGTFANRLVHWETDQAIIGPHVIDANRNVRTIEGLKNHRLAATMRHLTEPKSRVYFLTMEGLLFDVELATLNAQKIANLVEELRLPTGSQPHFKSAHTAQGRVVVANNTYEEPEYLGQRSAGRLAEWDGKTWTILERNPFVEVSGKQNPAPGSRYGNTLYAVGWDRASVILRVLHNGQWLRFRLPRNSHSWDHTWNTEWMRIREAQTERYLMDAFGLFYDLPGLVYGGRVWGIRPIASHLRVCPDFCSYRGLFVLAGDQTDNAVGQPQSGLWMGALDSLSRWGKPTGTGSIWENEQVEDGAVSDPFLMTGFDKKSVHLANDGPQPATISLEVDVLGDGTWRPYHRFELPANGGYTHHEFPDGFSAHWIRSRCAGSAVATVTFFYN